MPTPATAENAGTPLDHVLPNTPEAVARIAAALGLPLLIPDVHITRRVYAHMLATLNPPRINTAPRLTDITQHCDIQGITAFYLYEGAHNGIPIVRRVELRPPRPILLDDGDT